ncbi:MAG: zinc ribbon domain-containing protein [Selenomonadaceae bacterium]|nr:zinc ribbon domain-containing protein [Selenomonadaceae bacterium]
MADSKIFRMRGEVTIEGIGREVENFLRNEKDLTVEGFASSDGYLVQAKESSTWKKFTGMGQALQVQIIPSGSSEVLVNIGRGKWADKVGAGAIGALVFAPLAITSAIGAYKQNKLPSEIFACIEKFIMSGGVSVHRNVSFDRLNSSQMKCPSCGAVNTKGTKFCAGCGKKLTNVCPNCGNEVILGVKFCPNCGANMEQKKTNICPNCGAAVEEGKKFCAECGTNMEILNKDKCPACGTLVDKGQRFCPSCGANMSGNKICSGCGAELAPNQKFCGKCGTPAE